MLKFSEAMKHYCLRFLLSALACGMAFAVEIAPPAEQIASAVLAGPKEKRAEATVLGYDSKGAVVTLRKGSNELICLARDPNEKRFSVACYHKDLEPFMARGRELAAQGLKGNTRHEERWKEVQDRQSEDAPRRTHAIRAGGNGLRRRKERSNQSLPALGGLRSFRYTGIDRPLDHPWTGSLADVSRNSGRPHHD